jgi:hypothetical protein
MCFAEVISINNQLKLDVFYQIINTYNFIINQLKYDVF